MNKQVRQRQPALLAGSEKRQEDLGLITGKARFVDDIRLAEERPAVLSMVVVRSIFAHARLEKIEVEAARALPGVVDVITGQDLVGKLKPLESTGIPEMKQAPRPLLASKKVRYIGDPVAVILAENRYVAEDARDLLDIEYTPLEAVVDPEEAVLPGTPLLYEELGTNIVLTLSKKSGNVDKVFANAEFTTHLRLVNQRLAPSSLENRACLFDYDAQTGEFYAWVSSQGLFRLKGVLASALDLSPERVHVRNAAVGGAFGAKNTLLGEELLAAWLALKHECPIKWIEERSENLQAQSQGRGQINNLEVAFQSDGTLLGFKVHTLGDLGAFASGIGAMLPAISTNMLIGPYRVAAVESNVESVYTNKPPTGAYRGAGRPEATYMLERAMDQIARELGMDPAEVRRKNFIDPGAFPYQAVTGLLYDSGNYPALLDRLLELGEYLTWREKQREQRTHGGNRLLGLGLSTFTEISGGEMSGPPGSPKEAAIVRVRRDGTILAQSGVAHNGQGHFTLFARITAGVFSVPIEQVEVEMNNADLPVYGIGTFGSRTTQVAASVVLLAAEAAREKTLHAAAHIMEVAPADLELADGRVAVRGVPGRALALSDLARLVEERPELLVEETSEDEQRRGVTGLAAWRDFSPMGAAWSSGAHLAVVEVDSETGNIEILRYIAVDDCGRVLNPELAEAQLHGALAQGIGQALFEEMVYDQDGQLLTGTLMDYALPLAKELPAYTSDFVEVPSPTNPLGVKGVGESGTIGAPPTVVNAVLDALTPLGVDTIDMPLTREKVWRAIQETGSALAHLK
ncbi:xanthine dehydrogenase family protein molybdopterin-binding subunit [Ktedonospora formicarum]|uniref:Aldehyde dehydrogenase n=1 Tax=Ktedonospora formicarum TaxID=2778364 RepID=A0A8J3MPX6_9CHLR|nr:xanthine dehydrogenase family protein molybdopterin-binding subunit [Ktedonospora formicarum]GHO42043.1 aldehyde dehydrogenase [Ktedonospora formicarum]